MYLAPSLSDQQNAALWVICTFFATLISALFVVGILGSVQRNR
jgi:hypothetical protein